MGGHTAETCGAVERENVRINRVDFSFVKPRDTWFSVIQSAEWQGEGASAVPTSPAGKHARDPLSLRSRLPRLHRELYS